MSAQPSINGEKPNSQFINHLASYPLVSDALSTYQQNSLGAKSIELFNSLYATFAAPVLPYLATPYSIVHPYLERADSLGDASLAKVDERFPAVKQTDFETLRTKTSTYAGYPLRVAGETRDYVVRTYGDEHAKTKGSGPDGVLVTGQAVLSTELRIALEAFQAAWDFVAPRTEGAQRRFEEAKKEASQKAGEVKANGEAKTKEARKQMSK